MPEMKCPSCGGTKIQPVSETKIKGYGAGKGCCGAILFGPIGLLCGLCGMGKGKSRIAWVCCDCGKQF